MEREFARLHFGYVHRYCRMAKILLLITVSFFFAVA